MKTRTAQQAGPPQPDAPEPPTQDARQRQTGGASHAVFQAPFQAPFQACDAAPDTPYDLPGYAESYDALYLTAPQTAGHTRFEMDLVAKTCRKWREPSWCDVACGTGLHLRQTQPGQKQPPITRTGVDRSEAMLSLARRRDGHDVTFHCRDGRDMADLGRFDLVTGFWYGYIHQETLDDVFDLLAAMVRAVRPGGDLILGICDPAGLFETLPLNHPLVFGRPLEVQAIIWAYAEPECGEKPAGDGARFINCIAPHPQMIIERLSPAFAQAEWLDYPVLPASPNWRRKGLHLKNRLPDTAEMPDTATSSAEAASHQAT